MHKKHIVLVIMTPQSAKITFHLTAIKSVMLQKTNFWSMNSLEFLQTSNAIGDKNHRKSIHGKHIVVMIMTPQLAKITFAQNEESSTA